MATRWGVISAGRISNDFSKALSTLPPTEHKIEAVAARSIESAKSFAEKHGIPKWYDSYTALAKDENIDVVYIGAINPLHYEIAKLMLEYGKHVLCEKPLCMNYKQTKQLLDFAKEKNLFLMEALWSRFFPAYKQLRILLDNNVIGDALQVQVNFGTVISNDRIKLKELGGGTILDLGVYVLQFAMFVFGHEPESLVGVGHLNFDNVDESATYTLKYPNGKLATMTTHSRIKMRNSAIIYGTKGYIEVCEPFWCPTELKTPAKNFVFPLPEGQEGFNFINSAGLCYEAAEVRECLQKGLLESPLMSHMDSLTLARFEDDIRRSVGVAFPQDTK